MAQQATVGRSWQDVLITGVGAIIDSQRQMNYAVSEPAYNTQGGRAGTSQPTTGLQQVASSPIAWVIGGGVLLVILLVALKR